MIRFLILGLLFALAPPAYAGKLKTDAIASEHRRLNKVLIDSYIIPHYRQFASVTETLAFDAAQLCKQPKEENLKKAKVSFHKAMDAWMAIAHIHIGPVEKHHRQRAFQFWPERRNVVRRTVNQRLKSLDGQFLDDAVLTRSSIAGRGFPAMERLYFEKDVLAENETGRYACQMAKAIAKNIDGHAQAIVDGWITPGGYKDQLLNPHPNSPVFRTDAEATTELLRAMLTGLQTVVDLRLNLPLSRTLETAKPKRVENRLSGRGLRNVRIIVETVREMYLAGGKNSIATFVRDIGKKPDLDKNVVAGLDLILKRLEATKQPLGIVVASTELRPAMVTLQKEAFTFHRSIYEKLPPAVGLHVGFNSLDGDG